MKYIENVANPIVLIARLIYTPRHSEYMLCHISNHLPSKIVDELEELYKVNSFKDIENNLEMAVTLLNKYEKIIKEKYNI